MGVVLEPLHQLLDVLVQERVLGNGVVPALQLLLGRQLAEDNQIGDLEIVAVFGQLLDGIAAILKNALVAVDVGDGASDTPRC
jgi:hypothetical protein